MHQTHAGGTACFVRASARMSARLRDPFREGEADQMRDLGHEEGGEGGKGAWLRAPCMRICLPDWIDQVRGQIQLQPGDPELHSQLLRCRPLQLQPAVLRCWEPQMHPTKSAITRKDAQSRVWREAKP